MTLKQPKTTADLEPPFKHIGEQGWEERLRTLLAAYGVPEPQPVATGDISARESALGFRLDESVRQFLLVIGPVDFQSLRVLSPEEIEPLSGVWYASRLSERDRERLPNVVGVMDYLGKGDEFVGWERSASRFVRLGHDPAGVWEWLPTFDECIREQCVELAAGHYGWPDEETQRLVRDTKRRLFPGFRS